jgi:hypothetical protein
LSFTPVVGGKDPAGLTWCDEDEAESLTSKRANVILRRCRTWATSIDGKAGKPTLEELVCWIDPPDWI